MNNSYMFTLTGDYVAYLESHLLECMKNNFNTILVELNSHIVIKTDAKTTFVYFFMI